MSRRRKEDPDFATLLEASNSRFIAEMTECIATTAATDWRAAEAIFSRRFPTEFARDAAAVQFQLLNFNAPPPEAAEGRWSGRWSLRRCGRI